MNEKELQRRFDRAFMKERRLNEMIDDAHHVIIQLNLEINDLKKLIPPKKLREHYANKHQRANNENA